MGRTPSFVPLSVGETIPSRERWHPANRKRGMRFFRHFARCIFQCSLCIAFPRPLPPAGLPVLAGITARIHPCGRPANGLRGGEGIRFLIEAPEGIAAEDEGLGDA